MRRGFGADAGEHDLGRGAGEGLHGVVLGHPEAVVAKGVDVAGKARWSSGGPGRAWSRWGRATGRGWRGG